MAQYHIYGISEPFAPLSPIALFELEMGWSGHDGQKCGPHAHAAMTHKNGEEGIAGLVLGFRAALG